MDEPLGSNRIPSEPAVPGRRSRRLRPAPVEAAYVLVVATIATWGFAADSAAPILLAGLLALPTSVPAVIGYYLAFGLLAGLPGANPSSSSGSGSCSAGGDCRVTSTGDPAAWFTLTTDVIGILALTAAALLNVVVLRILVAQRATRRNTPDASQ